MMGKWIRKIKSGALQFSVFIAVLIAILLAGLILYAYTFVYLKQQSEAAVANVRLADVGFDHLLTSDVKPGSDTLTIPSEAEGQSVRAITSPWGVFEKAYVVTTHRKKRFDKVGLLATKLDRVESPTLYLSDENTPLVIVGNTRITGKAVLPEQGIRPGYIAGNSFYGKQLVAGTIGRSKGELPKLDKTYRAELKALTATLSENKSDENTGFLNQKHSVCSFREKTKVIRSDDPILLDDVRLTGNFIVRSDSLIVVKNTSALKDIILIAPIVEIEEGTTGTFQVIASERIKVNKNCVLAYPSALLLVQDPLKNSTPQYLHDKQLFIDENVQVKGVVGCLLEKIPTDFYPQIVLETSAKITGQVFCDGNLELKGTVFGSVYTRYFLTNQGGSIYLNHLFNGVIENQNIPDFYGGMLLEDQDKIVVKWLY